MGSRAAGRRGHSMSARPRRASPARLSMAQYRRLARGSAHPEVPTLVPVAPPDRYRSETERRFVAVLARWQAEAKIQAWVYEPCKGLYLAPKTSYTPDFLTVGTDGRISMYEVKGAFIRDKDRQKLKQAAALYWWWPFVLAQEIRGAWTLTRMPVD